MRKLDRPVLAEGEVTGHAHVLEADVDVFVRDTGEREFSTKSSVELVHEEHGKIRLPSGDYVSDKVLEYDHFEKAVRKVED